MVDLAAELDRLAEEQAFSGVVRVDRQGVIEFEVAYGLADRAHGIAATPATRFAAASGNKGLTALVVMQLIDAGRLTLSTPAREVLGSDLPLIADDVTIEHLLTHRSGIGDYLDEELDLDLDRDYLLPLPVQHLATVEAFVPLLDGHPTKFTAGARFSYCNGGFVVLALIAERVSGVPYQDLVEQRVCAPAGMTKTSFLRTDELPGDAAVGYVIVDGRYRSNVFHLPVRGTGDGGIYTTVGDMAAFWSALFGGAIVPTGVVAKMTRPYATDDEEPHCRYGRGFWLHPSTDAVFLDGCDSGVSFRSVHDPAQDLTHTVIANTTNGAWDITRLLATHLGTSWG
ncbi:MAG: beta-lactamase family protein [Acidimicrobiia bacterium]|nr:beta-lactamase family protein [Acidimicrobiia bacterium]